MLERLPSALGRMLRRARSGFRGLACKDASMRAVPETIQIWSPAFASGERMPALYTADGDRLSPPLMWRGVPDDTEALVLLIEDADSPTPLPLVHAIVWDLPPSDGELLTSALSSDSAEPGVGRNSLLKRTYLAPDPPSGHGVHRYAFQLFACDRALDFASAPGRTQIMEALRGHTLAKGFMIGTYERS
jgi:Raf kinase inhibitor-like YbhB/YbcL family protein